jgi:hypothetical protein
MPDDQWFLCDVMRAGAAEDGVVYIWLKDRGGQFDQWYDATQTVQREMLATALAAIATGYPVYVLLQGTTGYSTIDRLYIARDGSLALSPAGGAARPAKTDRPS